MNPRYGKPEVAAEAPEKEKRGEDVFPRTRPGNGLGVEGMDGPEQCDNERDSRSSTTLGMTRSQKQNHQHKHQHRIQRVQNQIGEVEPERLHPPDGIVHLIAQEGQRDVEFWIVGRECAFEAPPRDLTDDRILVNEHAVIPADEGIAKGRSIYKKRQADNEADGQESTSAHALYLI